MLIHIPIYICTTVKFWPNQSMETNQVCLEKQTVHILRKGKSQCSVSSLADA